MTQYTLVCYYRHRQMYIRFNFVRQTLILYQLVVSMDKLFSGTLLNITKNLFQATKRVRKSFQSYLSDRERHLANHLERHLASIILETPLSQKRNKVCLVKNKGPIRQSSCGKQYQLLKMVTRHQFHKFNGLQR